MVHPIYFYVACTTETLGVEQGPAPRDTPTTSSPALGAQAAPASPGSRLTRCGGASIASTGRRHWCRTRRGPRSRCPGPRRSGSVGACTTPCLCSASRYVQGLRAVGKGGWVGVLRGGRARSWNRDMCAYCAVVQCEPQTTGCLWWQPGEGPDRARCTCAGVSQRFCGVEVERRRKTVIRICTTGANTETRKYPPENVSAEPWSSQPELFTPAGRSTKPAGVFDRVAAPTRRSATLVSVNMCPVVPRPSGKVYSSAIAHGRCVFPPSPIPPKASMMTSF